MTATTRPTFGDGAGKAGGVHRLLPVTALLLAALLLLAGCGKSSGTATGSTRAAPTAAGGTTTAANCPTSNTTAFAKTKFVLHTGLAFGTFHRYIYKPLKAGGFSKGAHGRIGAFLKAGATALFMKREIRLASEDVKANPALCRAIAAPLGKLSGAISGGVTKLKDGDTSGITDANTQISSITSKSAAGGAPITERTDQSAG